MKVWSYDKVKALKEIEDTGRKGLVIKTKSGVEHILLRNGMHIRRDGKDRTSDLSPRQRRKHEKEMRRREKAVPKVVINTGPDQPGILSSSLSESAP